MKETLTIRTNSEDNLLLVSYLENEEIMIFSEKGENEDQRVPPPLQNNVVDEEEIDEEVLFEDTDQDVN